MSSISAVLIPFIGGLIVGSLLVWLLLPARRNQQRLEAEKQKALQELANYRKDVDSHFLKTAELVNNMTSAYRAVHEQLTVGAETLCSEENRLRVLSQTALANGIIDHSEAETYLERPLDYAPESQGTLSEDFGLKNASTTHTIPASATSDIEAPRDYAAGCTDQGCSTTDEPIEENTQKPA